ncbi:hypothetical protein OH77DRAFT_896661 [Trametes cingulata]|nr:hypothetical protein OH77DRAFT_896661 [Trametes cingulata]
MVGPSRKDIVTLPLSMTVSSARQIRAHPEGPQCLCPATRSEDHSSDFHCVTRLAVCRERIGCETLPETSAGSLNSPPGPCANVASGPLMFGAGE